MLKLQFKDQRKPAIWLVDARCSIGKDTQNTIILGDDGVSPFHAEIRVEGDQVFLTDTGSANGTFVNGKRIQRRTELRSGDTIGIHTVQLMLVDPKQEMQGATDGATAITPALANIQIAAAGKAGTGWTLKAKTGSLVGKEFPVPPAGKLVVGRANNCDIQLPANQVSRQHAEVQLVGGKLLIKDLNSSNGTFINRKKISEGEVKAGDEVRFDTFTFEVIGPGGSAPAAAEEPEHTQFRPAAPAAAPAGKPKPDAPAAQPAARPAAAPKTPSPTATTRIQSKMEAQAVAPAAAPAGNGDAGGGNGRVIAIAVAVVLAAAAGWFFFLK